MRYFAEWNSATGELEITEQGEGGASEVIHSDVASDNRVAADLVKEWGFGFRDMWTVQKGNFTYKAPLKAMDHS